jgi:transcriptional regulator GlxA family with amidase domain
LAEAGLLDGYRATIHWDELDRFSERFSDIDVQKEAVIYDRDRITCGGASTAFALAMQMIEKQHGAALRLRVEHLFSGAYAQRPVRRGGIAARAVDLMRAHIEEPLPIAQLAQQLGRSQKHLEQQMLARLGAAPQVIYRRIRLERARQLSLDTTISVAEISRALRLSRRQCHDPCISFRIWHHAAGLAPGIDLGGDYRAPAGRSMRRNCCPLRPRWL